MQIFEALRRFAEKPPVFSRDTVSDLWTDAHIAERMLSLHLDPEAALASRRAFEIDDSVAWLNSQVSLSGKRLCDLGCGPGLYTSRFCSLGAEVIGLDFSPTSIAYARREAARLQQKITYEEADYTKAGLPHGLDIVTLIFWDFAVMAPDTRAALLRKIKDALNPGGSFVLDVPSLHAFDQFREETLVEPQLMEGFWSPGSYIGLKKSYRYEAETVSLDRYWIVEESREREIFNWLQYFSEETLTAQLKSAGFVPTVIAGSLTGEPVRAQSDTLAVIAEAR
eukprot:s1_g516.t1